MIIKPSSALRNNYSSISSIAKETQEPVYITVNGEGEFYTLRREVDKLMIDAVRGVNGLKVESGNQYADLPEGFTGSLKYDE